MVVGDFPLGGKVAVVTGGGSGINLAFVRLAVAAGAKCLIADLKLTAEAEALTKGHPDKIAFVKCDVAEWAELEAIPSQIETAFGSGVVADVWVAGAGVFEPQWSSFLYDTETDYYRTIRINTEHPIKLTRIAMRSCLGANKPCVVLITASTAGLGGIYSAALYCASKHAIVGFVKSMAAADAEENVKVVSVLPGVVDTPLWTDTQAAGVAKQFGFSAERAIRPEDVAQVMVELVEQGQYPGGTLLGVRSDNMREILESRQAWPFKDVDGEQSKAYRETNYTPLREVFKKERKPE